MNADSRTRLWALLWIAAVVLGCGRQQDSEYFGTVKPLHPPDELWINNSNEPEWIDPGKCSDSTGGEVIRNMFCGLCQLHPATLEPMPEIAERYELSQDAMQLTFYLRESQWSDGTPLTAHDFEWSWKRVLNPATASKYSIIMYPLKNGDCYSEQALVLTGAASASDEEITAWVDEVIPCLKLKRDGENVFAFVSEVSEEAAKELKRKPITRDVAIKQLSNRTLGESTVSVKLTDASFVGLRAEGDHKLIIDLEYPVPYFLSLTSFYTYMPVPRHVIEKLESEGKDPDLWTRPEYVACNGAYKMTEWKFRQYMLFEKNEKYWDVDNSEMFHAERIRLLMIESYNTALNMYCLGEMDWMGAQTMVPSEFIDSMKGYGDYENNRKVGVYFYWFNVERPPCDDPRVRRALSLAIDREQITKYVTRAGQIPMGTVVPDGLAGYDANERPLFDPEKARALLAEAGYPGGKGFPPTTLIYNTTEQHKQIASAAQQMWKDNLGIEVVIENQEWQVYLRRLMEVDFQIARMGWIGDYADPNTFLELFASSNGNNHSNWGDPKYDEMLLDANRTIDKQARLDKLREVEAYALEHQPILPIYVYTTPSMVKPYLGGYFGNDQDFHPWKYLYIKEEWYEGKPENVVEDEPPSVTPVPGGVL